MNVLVVGSTGQVGCALISAQWPQGIQCIGVARPALDLSSRESVEGALDRHHPHLVINAAAYTAVDAAESERSLAFAVNCAGPETLATACARRGVPFVHLSTDYVFDGSALAPYREDDPIGPINVYGMSKAAGEAAVRLRHHEHIILRTAWVYSSTGHNFARTILRLAQERPTLRVIADQRGTPTSAAEIAGALITIAGRLRGLDRGSDHVPWGTFHFTAAGETTWHGFADHILRRYELAGGRRPVLEAISTSEYPTPARRPANSRLDCSRIEAVFGVTRTPWQEGADRVLGSLIGKERASGRSADRS